MKRAATALVIALLALRIGGSLVCFLAAMPFVRRRAVWRFRRRLRRNGISWNVASELADSYAEGVSLFGRRQAHEA